MPNNWVPDPRSKGVEVFVLNPSQPSLTGSSDSVVSQPFNTGWDDFLAQITTAASSVHNTSITSTPPSSPVVDESNIHSQLLHEYTGTAQKHLDLSPSKTLESTNARLLSRIKQFKINSDNDDASYIHSDSGSDTSSMSIDTPSRRPVAKVPSILHHSQTHRVSHHFKQHTPTPTQKAIPRPAWLRTSGNSKVKKPVPKTKNQQALDSLRDIERGSPTHYWSPSERTFLCVLNRWYRRSPKAFHVIFNAAYNLELSPRKVTAQFENHLRLFGGNAFREYEEVFSVPFDDPQGAYEEMRRVIENQAEALGVEVVRLTEENAWERSEIVGSGRKARAQATRDIYKALVRKRRLEQAVQGRNGLSEQTGSGQSLSMLRGHAISRGSEVYEEVVGIKGPASFPFPRAGQQLPVTEESFSPYSGALPALNSKHPPCTLTPSSSLPSTPLSQQTRSTTPPVLAFRVFSTSSRSQLTPTGFRSELFQNWVGPITQPLPQTTPLFNVLALNHFSMRSQCSSAFISCAISLIQVLNKPVAKGHGENPQLCLIDLTQLYENPEENKASQVYSAQHVIQDLKNKGQMNWRRNRHGNGQMSPTRYKGLSEYIVWGEIPAEAVISAVSLAEIADVAGEFLCFECFTAGRHTGAVADEIKEKGIALGMKEARKMGELARLVGLAQAESVVQLAHVSAFIAALVDGWYIRSEGTQSPSVEVAMSFARALNSHVFTNKEVIDAFFQGVRRGLENVGYFEGRRWSK